jgi:hypothetical protein
VLRSDSHFLLLTRVGFVARGLMYLLVAYLTLWVGRAEDAGEALAHLRRGGSAILLAAMAVGFGAYGVWRLVDAALDVEHRGHGAKGAMVRLSHAGSGIIHLGLGFKAARLTLGDAAAHGGSSQAAEDGAATAMTLPGGDLLLFAAASILLIMAGNQLLKAVRRRFLRHLIADAQRKPWVILIGIAGHAARAVLFAVAAWLLYRAAIDHSAAEAGGLGDALTNLPGLYRTLVAAGLAMFGAYSLIEARYRVIPDPHIGARVAEAAARR